MNLIERITDRKDLYEDIYDDVVLLKKDRDALAEQLQQAQAQYDALARACDKACEQLEQSRQREGRYIKNDWNGIKRLCDYIDTNHVPSPWRDTGRRLRNISKQLRRMAEQALKEK